MTKKTKTSPALAKLLFAGEYANYLASATWLAVALLILFFGGTGPFAPATTGIAHATLGFLCRWTRQQ